MNCSFKKSILFLIWSQCLFKSHNILKNNLRTGIVVFSIFLPVTKNFRKLFESYHQHIKPKKYKDKLTHYLNAHARKILLNNFVIQWNFTHLHYGSHCNTVAPVYFTSCFCFPSDRLVWGKGCQTEFKESGRATL